MREFLALAAGWAAGAATMYYLDPHGGPRRRAIARDRLVAWSHDAGVLAQRGGRRAANRVRGMAAARRARRHESPPQSDEPGSVPEFQGARDAQASSSSSLLGSALAVLAIAAPTAIVLGAAGAWRDGKGG